MLNILDYQIMQVRDQKASFSGALLGNSSIQDERIAAS